MSTSLIGRTKNINRHLKSFRHTFRSLVETTSADIDDGNAASVDTKKKKNGRRQFAPCASSEPQNNKDMWIDKLRLPYYKAFDKIRSKTVTPEEEKVDARLKISPNPVPVGIGLTRENVMDEQLAKLIKEYVTQRDANVKMMKTQMRSGREPDDKTPHIVVEKNDGKFNPNTEDATATNSTNTRKPPKDTRIIRAV